MELCLFVVNGLLTMREDIELVLRDDTSDSKTPYLGLEECIFPPLGIGCLCPTDDVIALTVYRKTTAVGQRYITL